MRNIENNILLIIWIASFKKEQNKFHRFEICAPYPLLARINSLQHTYKTLQLMKLSVSNIHGVSEQYGNNKVYNFKIQKSKYYSSLLKWYIWFTSYNGDDYEENIVIIFQV